MSLISPLLSRQLLVGAVCHPSVHQTHRALSTRMITMMILPGLLDQPIVRILVVPEFQ
jgi:hypothetical protein